MQLVREDFDVVPIELKDGFVAQQIHVGGNRVEQHLLLGHAQRRLRTHDLAFRLANAVGRLKAVEQGLRSHGADPARKIRLVRGTESVRSRHS